MEPVIVLLVVVDHGTLEWGAVPHNLCNLAPFLYASKVSVEQVKVTRTYSHGGGGGEPESVQSPRDYTVMHKVGKAEE